MNILGVLLVIAVTLAVVVADYPNCKPPDVPRYGGHNKEGQYSYPVGTVVYFYCDRGYKLHGYSKTVCRYNSYRKRSYWSYPSPVCKKHVVDCGYLRNPSYGWVHTKCTYVGCKATYSCKYGYELKGVKERYCKSNGYWSDYAPKCVRKH